MDDSQTAARANGSKTYVGIPDDLTLQAATDWVAGRVSKKRLNHIHGVVSVGGKLARALHLDPYPIELACMLHDSSKELKPKELIAIAKGRGMKLIPHEEEHGHVLHGPVGAIIASETFGLTNKDVLDAIAEHTLGSVKMCTVSKVVYIADKIEESRPTELTEPIWEALGTKHLHLHDHNHRHGKLNLDLDAAILASCNMVLSHLLKKNKPIHPKSVTVRNHFLLLVKKSEDDQGD